MEICAVNILNNECNNLITLQECSSVCLGLFLLMVKSFLNYFDFKLIVVTPIWELNYCTINCITWPSRSFTVIQAGLRLFLSLAGNFAAPKPLHGQPFLNSHSKAFIVQLCFDRHFRPLCLSRVAWLQGLWYRTMLFLQLFSGLCYSWDKPLSTKALLLRFMFEYQNRQFFS